MAKLQRRFGIVRPYATEILERPHRVRPAFKPKEEIGENNLDVCILAMAQRKLHQLFQMILLCAGTRSTHQVQQLSGALSWGSIRSRGSSNRATVLPPNQLRHDVSSTLQVLCPTHSIFVLTTLSCVAKLLASRISRAYEHCLRPLRGRED